MMRRRFSKKERNALFLAADGRSEISGEPLDEWHADHIIPYSKGGITDVSNAQAITAQENMQKSNHIADELFAWQKEFSLLFQQSEAADISLAALPGGGKTRATLAPVSRWLRGSSARKIGVVAPTNIVRKQWRDVAHDYYDIELQTIEFSGSIKPGFDGFVTTYSAVVSEPLLFRRLCSKHDMLVVFDEIHHAGDQSAWGAAIFNAFELASRRICLSGTPFRHDTQRIPFLRVGKDGFYEMDFTYDYPRALRDGVIRDLAFHWFGGSADVALAGDIKKFHTDDELNQNETCVRLAGLLKSPDQTFTRDLLQAAHQKLLHVRRAKPDAAALALAIDGFHAGKIAKLLEEVTGEAPDIIVSDKEIATISSVEKFLKDPSKKWLVAVRMVSEGADIPKLMVEAYLTNTVTELFFRQALGRIMRNQRTDADTEAYCFLPDDPRLRAFAATIEKFQQQIIFEEEDAQRKAADRNADIERRYMEFLSSSEAELVGLTLRGKDHPASIKDAAIEHGISENAVADILSRFAGMQPQQPKPCDVSKEERMGQLRRRCSTLTNKVALRRGVEPKDIHIEWMKKANVRTADMTESQLEEKQAWLLKQL